MHVSVRARSAGAVRYSREIEKEDGGRAKVPRADTSSLDLFLFFSLFFFFFLLHLFFSLAEGT